MIRVLWMALAVVALSLLTLPLASDAVAADGDSPTVKLPLTSGHLAVRDVLTPIAGRLGMEDLAPLENLDWTIDVRSLTGRLQLTAIERLTNGAVELTIKADALEITFDQPRMAAAAATTVDSLMKWVAGVQNSDGHREPDMHRFGLTFITADDPRAAVDAIPPEARDRIVVLVHGLDDPGIMWTDLIPAMHEAGFVVGRFEYPNDGPIAEAADLFAHVLEQIRAGGIQRIDVVAHSMGGLVARDVLTRRSYMNGDGSGANRFPAVDHLVLCGTPNRGSELARFRGLIELREHLQTSVTTGASFRDLAAGDGNGEAGEDLLPRSEFLRRLNARAIPSHTQISIIAGRVSPVSNRTLQWLARTSRRVARSENSPEWLKDAASGSVAKAVEGVAKGAADGLGDGCVSIESATLEGVDDITIVRGGHLSMLLNLRGEKTPPPALPIILDRLKRSD